MFIKGYIIVAVTVSLHSNAHSFKEENACRCKSYLVTKKNKIYMTKFNWQINSTTIFLSFSTHGCRAGVITLSEKMVYFGLKYKIFLDTLNRCSYIKKSDYFHNNSVLGTAEIPFLSLKGFTHFWLQVTKYYLEVGLRGEPAFLTAFDNELLAFNFIYLEPGVGGVMQYEICPCTLLSNLN